MLRYSADRLPDERDLLPPMDYLLGPAAVDLGGREQSDAMVPVLVVVPAVVGLPP